MLLDGLRRSIVVMIKISVDLLGIVEVMGM